MRDYDPSKLAGAGARESGGGDVWEDLEMRAAMGVRGVLQENFVQSVQIMDQSTDNTQMPYTVVKGEGTHPETELIISIQLTKIWSNASQIFTIFRVLKHLWRAKISF